MTQPTIAIESLNSEICHAYSSADLSRGASGPDAIAWTFRDNPEPFSVAREAGSIVGISGYIKSRMKFGPSTGHSYQAIDSYVSPSMRGKGVFTALAQAYESHIKDRGGAAVWGFPNDNAAPAWFSKMDWRKHGQTPFMIKPLRTGYFLKKAKIDIDFPISIHKNQNLSSIDYIDDSVSEIWDRFSKGIQVSNIRDRSYLSHRLTNSPWSTEYRIVADTKNAFGAIVASRVLTKHGGRIAYIMESFGSSSLTDLLASELGYLREEEQCDLALAWAFPWSPNYKALRKVGFFPLPERVRPISIWFGAKPLSAQAALVNDTRNWYLSYLDSDTV
ncbi:GNAT family N-acetyltransferase [Amorphus sp. 3PC139-8]|uniref:GNAT family N-acetyltransferase n=1 Tax=Amorphus sp. 3PC139-8 TaxID=2735676 RepID=UPI00345D58D7